jgi:hypothetical protein
VLPLVKVLIAIAAAAAAAAITTTEIYHGTAATAVHSA